MQTHTNTLTNTKTHKNTLTHTETHTHTDTLTHTETHTHTNTLTHTERHTHTLIHIQKNKQRKTQTDSTKGLVTWPTFSPVPSFTLEALTSSHKRKKDEGEVERLYKHQIKPPQPSITPVPNHHNPLKHTSLRENAHP